ncbi:MAG: TIGR03084 family metal-binding protein [Actinomycetota bacterium]
MSGGMGSICADLEAEHHELDAVVAALPDEEWDRSTPAEGWSIRDTISHLAYFDGTATTSALEPELFVQETEAALESGRDLIAEGTEMGRALDPPDVLDWWRQRRAAMLDAFRPLGASDRLPWYGPPMAARSFATARLMETWAHGQDVFDSLGVDRLPTERLRHVAHIGVRARPFAYFTNEREMPAAEIRVELTGPGGDVWTWGPEEAADRVTGPALDFCLVVTQRRHPDDVSIETEGDAAADWISIAQAFAGPPGGGREPGQF